LAAESFVNLSRATLLQMIFSGRRKERGQLFHSAVSNTHCQDWKITIGQRLFAAATAANPVQLLQQKAKRSLSYAKAHPQSWWMKR